MDVPAAALSLVQGLTGRPASLMEQRLVLSILTGNYPLPPLDTFSTDVALLLDLQGLERRRAQTLIHELHEAGGVKRLGAILYVLRALSGTKQHCYLAPLSAPGAPLEVESAQTQPQGRALTPPPKKSRNNKHNKKRHLRAILFGSSGSEDDEQDDPQYPDYGQRTEAVRADAAAELQEINKDLIPEHLLVRDLLYAMQGISGSFFELRRDERSQLLHFQMRPGVTRKLVAPVLSSYCERIASCGFFFVRCTELLRASGRSHMGKTRNALAEGVSAALTEYKLLVSQIDGRVQLEDIRLPDLAAVSNTIREDISVLTMIADGCLYSASDRRASLHALQILNRLYFFSGHGDPKIASVGRSLLAKAAIPFFGYLKTWIITGVLDEVAREFVFVRTTERSDDILLFPADEKLASHSVHINSPWYNGYHISARHANQTAPLLDPSVLRLCFWVGRASAFLRESCRMRDWCVPEPLVKALWDADFMHILGTRAINVGDPILRLLHTVNDLTSTALVDALKRKANLLDHYAGLLHIVLGKQGDFIPALLGMMDTRSPADRFHHLSLMELVDGAIAACNVAHMPGYVLACVGVRVVSEGRAFVLTYRVDPPLSAIITPGQVEIYEFIFRLQWQLRAADGKLDKVTALLTSYDRVVRQELMQRAGINGKIRINWGSYSRQVSRGYRMALFKLHILKHRTKNALAAILNYVCHDCIDPAYRELLAHSERAKSIKELIYWHDIAVRTLCYKLLIAREYHHLPVPERPAPVPQDPRDEPVMLHDVFNPQHLFSSTMQEVFPRFHGAIERLSTAVDGLWHVARELQNNKQIDSLEFTETLSTVFNFADRYTASFRADIQALIGCLQRCRNMQITTLDTFDYSCFEHLEEALTCVSMEL